VVSENREIIILRLQGKMSTGVWEDILSDDLGRLQVKDPPKAEDLGDDDGNGK